jgi:hypothetical protein
LDPAVPARTLRGRQGFIDSYKDLHAFAKETLGLGDFIDGGDMFAAEILTKFEYLKDMAASPGRLARKKGEIATMTNFCVYTLENGKFKRIRICHFRMNDERAAKL